MNTFQKKPCPFCGSMIAPCYDPDKGGEGGIIICDASTGLLGSNKGGCGASTGWASSEEDAWESWNTRFKGKVVISKVFFRKSPTRKLWL